MWPVIMAMARTYAPYVVLPIATVIGFVGNKQLEKLLVRHFGPRRFGGVVGFFVFSQ